MYGMDWGVPVFELRYDWDISKKRTCESVNVLGGTIGANFVPQSNMIACGAVRLEFSPTFLHVLSAFLGIELSSRLLTYELTI